MHVTKNVIRPSHAIIDHVRLGRDTNKRQWRLQRHYGSRKVVKFFTTDRPIDPKYNCCHVTWCLNCKSWSVISPLGFVTDNKLCVSGRITLRMNSNHGLYKDRKIEFGQTFQRIPAFAAALNYVNLKTSSSSTRAQLYNFRVTNSSAVVTINGVRCRDLQLSWIACL